MLKVVPEASEGGKKVFYKDSIPRCGRSISGAPQTDSMVLRLLKEIAEENGYLFNPHKNGLVDKQRLNGERWNRWVA